jgi:AraC-like DNA-binding protein
VHAFHYQQNAKGFIVSCSRDFLNGMTAENAALAEARQRLLACCGSPLEGDTDRIEQVCLMLSDYAGHPVGGPGLEARYIFYHLWLLLRRSSGLPDKGGPQSASTEILLFNRFRGILEDSFRYSEGTDYGANLRKTAEYFSARLDVSVFQLNKCSRQVAGMTANELIKQTLLAEATRLLIYTAIPVKDISDFLGYSNSSHFIRFFKLERGLAPDAFRNANTIFTRLQS